MIPDSVGMDRQDRQQISVPEKASTTKQAFLRFYLTRSDHTTTRLRSQHRPDDPPTPELLTTTTLDGTKRAPLPFIQEISEVESAAEKNFRRHQRDQLSG